MRASSTIAGAIQEPVDKSNHRNAVAAPGSRITRAMAAICATGLVIASGGFGAVFAWHSGMQHGIELACLSVLMALALEGCKPLAVAAAFSAFGSWRIFTGLALSMLAAVAVAYSLTAELSLIATVRHDLQAKRAAAPTAVQRERIEAELKALGVVRPAAQINADLAGLLAAHRIDACEPWLPVKQRTVCAEQVQPLRAELARAQRREALERDLAGLSSASSPATVTADPGAAALAMYLSTLGLTVPVQALSQWMTLVAVLALEIGSALAVLLVKSVQPATVHKPVSYAAPVDSQKPTTTGFQLSTDTGAVDTPVQPAALPAPDCPPPAEQPRRRRLGPMAKRGKDEVADQLVDTIKAAGGKLPEASVRGLAGRIGASKSTVHNAVVALIAAGVVTRIGEELVLRS